MEKSLVKYFDRNNLVLKSIKLTGLNSVDLLENSPRGAAYLGIYKEPVRYAKLTIEELDKICEKGEKIAKTCSN